MDAPISNQQIVSQSEVESLLSQIGSGDAPPETQAAPISKGGAEFRTVTPYIFRQLSSFSPAQLRKLRVRHEEFIQQLAARLSVHLRLEILLKMSRLDTMSFGKFRNELSSPTYLALLELEPLKGICLLDIPSQLGSSIIDRELGGEGTCGLDERALTDIEARILSKTVEITINEWCSSWQDMLDLKPALIGHENDGAFIQRYAPEASMLVLGIEMQIGELTKQIHFCFPFQMLEPLIQKLNLEADGGKKPAAKIPTQPLKWNPLLDEVPIDVSARLRGLKLPAKQVAQLAIGDVIAFDSEMFQQVQLSLAQKTKFVASLGRSGPNWAAKISKIVDG